MKHQLVTNQSIVFFQVHLIGTKELKNSFTFQKDAQQKGNANASDVPICQIVRTFGTRIGSARNVVKETDAITI